MMAPEGRQGVQKRKRTKFDKNQFQILMAAFERDNYPDFTIREELSKLTQIPESRIQVWFQNRRARKRKTTQRLSVETYKEVPEVRVPEGGHHGACVPNCSYQQGGVQGDACHFWESEAASGRAILLGHAGILSMKMKAPDRTPGEPSGDFHHTPTSGLIPPALSLLPAPQRGRATAGTGTHPEDPRLYMACGHGVLQGLEQCPPSCEQQPSMMGPGEWPPQPLPP